MQCGEFTRMCHSHLAHSKVFGGCWSDYRLSVLGFRLWVIVVDGAVFACLRCTFCQLRVVNSTQREVNCYSC